jgi:hypothetical protein
MVMTTRLAAAWISETIRRWLFSRGYPGPLGKVCAVTSPVILGSGK